ncbi:MAG: RNA polymerase factor sigma-32, partial [Pseudomonadota bacterium]
MSKSTPSVPALSGEQSLNRYLSEIKKYPVLTA